MDAFGVIGRIAGMLVIVTAASACDPADSARRGAELVAQSKASMGGAGWDRIEVWHEVGYAAPRGEASYRYEHWGDLQSLATRNQSGTKALVFDSVAAFRCTDTGCTASGDDASRALKEGAYAAGFGFFFPQRFPVAYSYQGTKAEDGVTFEVVRVSPRGMRWFDLWIDQSTHYIARLIMSDGRTTTELSDYREVGGVTVPFEVNEQDVVIRADSIAFEPAGSASFEPRPLASEPQPN